MKKEKNTPPKKTFKITGFIFIWSAALAVAVIFTQALRNPISYIFLIIVCAVLPIDFIYTFIASFSVAAFSRCGASKTGKNESVGFFVSISNNSILPLPFTCADIVLPGTETVYMRVPLMSFGKNEYEKEISFPYKGEYFCGVEDVYVSGLFRIFQIKLQVNEKSSVTVLPSRISDNVLSGAGLTGGQASDDNARRETDGAEITEIKEYAPGDPIRNIHWKLSTKVEELMTKHFGSEDGFSVCVISDSKEYYSRTDDAFDVNEYCDDNVCAVCCSTLFSALNRGRKTALIYSDTHAPAHIDKRCFDSAAEFEEFLPYYAACRPSAADAAELLSAASGYDGDHAFFVTSRLTDGVISALCAAKTTVTAVLIAPYSKSGDGAGLKKETEACLRQLYSAGVDVIPLNENELYEKR